MTACIGDRYSAALRHTEKRKSFQSKLINDYFEIMATAGTCELLPHYGRQPSYLRYRGAYDGC